MTEIEECQSVSFLSEHCILDIAEDVCFPLLTPR